MTKFIWSLPTLRNFRFLSHQVCCHKFVKIILFFIMEKLSITNIRPLGESWDPQATWSTYQWWPLFREVCHLVRTTGDGQWDEAVPPQKHRWHRWSLEHKFNSNIPKTRTDASRKPEVCIFWSGWQNDDSKWIILRRVAWVKPHGLCQQGDDEWNIDVPWYERSGQDSITRFRFCRVDIRTCPNWFVVRFS